MSYRFFKIWATGLVLAALVLTCKSANFSIPPTPDRRTYTVPKQLKDGWQTASLSSVDMDEDLMRQLTRKLALQEFPNVHGVLVVKNGFLVYEEYFTGIDFRWGKPLGTVAFDRETLHDLRSVTKSVTSSLVGIAAGEGKIADIDQPIFDFFPQYAELKTPANAKITIRHALTMTAGLDWDEKSVSYRDSRNSATAMAYSPDPVKFVLQKDVIIKPGSQYTYNGGLTNILAAIIRKTTGSNIDEYAQTALFASLGIDTYEWVKYDSGFPVSASGLRLRPRDIAKFGYLYVNAGKWQDRQVVSGQWIIDSVKSHVNIRKQVDYGYQWWIVTVRTADGEFKIYEASGNGGQRIYVAPEFDLVVVITGGNYDLREQNIRFTPWRILSQYILPAAGYSR